VRKTRNNGRGGKALGIEKLILLIILLTLAVSAGYIYFRIKEQTARVVARKWMDPGKVNRMCTLENKSLLHAVDSLTWSVQAGGRKKYVFSSEPRVIAVGSLYPIPFEAEICPFSGIKQPGMGQFDRDGDGITDLWEDKYGLDKYRSADALQDKDNDGFTNLEEFSGNTDPTDPDSHPPFASKLRFVESKVRMFKFKFLAVTELPNNRKVFQLNSGGKTYFRELGETIDEHMQVKAYCPKKGKEPEKLILERAGEEIVLPKGAIIREPESQAELINLLDNNTITVTMHQLLSIDGEIYEVTGIDTNSATVRSVETGDLFAVMALNEEERVKFLGGNYKERVSSGR